VTAPLTSIVILTHNELEYTRRCVASIQANTPEPHELVFVDNASTDGTLEYLRALPGAVVIANEQNLGFGGGCNQGLAVARGERLLLLNNDTVATPGWLSAMLEALDRDTRLGIVGPRSNSVAGAQRVEAVTYDEDSLDGLTAYSGRWALGHVGEVTLTPRVIGFCLLMRREVLTQIGGFDVRFGIGNFEDDDLCIRAGVAGWGVGIAHDSFVHHFGSRTFTGARVNYTAQMESNWDRFASKWDAVGVRNGEGQLLGYDPAGILERARFEPARHYAPLVARPYAGETATFEHRGEAVLLAADDGDAAATALALRQACTALRAVSSVTLVVRVDPADTSTVPALERLADELGDAALPDIVLLEASELNDEAAVRASHKVIAFGRRAAALAGLAAWCGVPSTTPARLAAR